MINSFRVLLHSIHVHRQHMKHMKNVYVEASARCVNVHKFHSISFSIQNVTCSFVLCALQEWKEKQAAAQCAVEWWCEQLGRLAVAVTAAVGTDPLHPTKHPNSPGRPRGSRK